MPSAKLPTNFKGWMVATIAALVGLISGLLTIKLLGGK